MAFQLLLAPGRNDQISHLRRQEATQPAHAFDFAYLVGDALLQVLVEFLYLLRSVSQFFKKTRVLDSNHGLRGEVLDQVYLLVGKRTNILSAQSETANQLALFEHRHGDVAAHSSKLNRRDVRRVASLNVACLGTYIGNANRFFHRKHSTDPHLRIRTVMGETSSVFCEGGRRIVCGNKMPGFAVPAVDVSKMRVADTNSLFQHGGEDRLKIARRARDNLQNVRCSCLLLKRFREVCCAFGEVRCALTQFVEQPRVLDGDDGLGGEVL